jgi:hypothetical protein
MPAFKRLRQVLGNPKSSPQEIGQTMMMLKHIRKLPSHIQEQMKNPEIPILQITQELRQYAKENPDEAEGILSPVLKDLAPLPSSRTVRDSDKAELE